MTRSLGRAARAVLVVSFMMGCSAAPPMKEDTVVALHVESPVPMGFYARDYRSPVTTQTPGGPEKICDAPCDTNVTVGPGRHYWVGEAIGGPEVVFHPGDKEVTVTVDPGKPDLAVAGGALVFGGGISMLIGALMFVIPVNGPVTIDTPTFIAGLTFGGTGIVAGAIGIPLVAAFGMKADVRRPGAH